jgi:hypothetical protein
MRRLDEDHRHDDQQAEHHDQAEDECLVHPQDAGALAREPGHDRREDDDRHAVADAPLGDQLTEPHDQRGSRRQRQHRQREALVVQAGEDVDAGQELLVVGQRHDAGRLQDRQPDGDVSGDLLDPLAAGLAFLLELLQPGDHHAEQLHDDRRGDVGHDAQREDGELGQRPAREQVDQREGAVVLGARAVQEGVDGLEVHSGDRQVGAQAVDRDDPQREEDLAP